MVRTILADPRFALHASSGPAARWWLDDVRDWIAHLVRQIFHSLDHALGARTPLDTVIGWAVIVAAFALGGYCVYALVRSAAWPPRWGPDGLRSDPLSAGEHSSVTLRLAAIAAARAGRRRVAAGLIFGAAARALDERGRVAYDPARTPGEYRRILNDPAFDAFAALTVVALFAAGEPHADEFDRMLGMFDRLFALEPSSR